LRGVNLRFRRNEFVSILGASGCGKTTLLNIVGGLDQYTSGDLVINGVSTKNYKDRDWDVYRNHRIGFIFQSYNLIPHQTVLGNVELALTIAGLNKKERVEKGVYKDVTAHDVVKYGIIPELVGRLPVIVALDNLDEDSLVRILREPKNALYKQYQKLLALDGIELLFEDDALRAIAHEAIERNIGARGLRSIMEEIMMQPMYTLPSRTDVEKAIITKGYVKKEEDLKLVLKQDSANV
jgi:ATP-dependent protease Clp ATPase subunit